MLRIRRTVDFHGSQIVLDVERFIEAVLVAILGNVREACSANLARAAVRYIGAADRDLAAIGLCEADKRVCQLALAVAIDARDAENLAPMDLKGNALELRKLALGGYNQIFNLQHNLVADG